MAEVQLLLAEKRTALSILRIGIAVLTLPLSVLGLLVVTSKYYDPGKVPQFLVPLLALAVGLVLLGVYLIIHSFRSMRRYDRLIQRIKQKYSAIAELIFS